MKNFRRVSSMAAPQSAPAPAALDILGRFGPGGGRLVICLTPGLVSGAELLFLLIEHVASAIHPVTRLFACPASLLPRSLGAFLRLGANYVACFIARARRVQHTDYRSDTETRQEPQEAVAITIRHNYLLNFSIGDGSTLKCERQFAGGGTGVSRACPERSRRVRPGGEARLSTNQLFRPYQRSSCAGRAKGGE